MKSIYKNTSLKTRRVGQGTGFIVSFWERRFKLSKVILVVLYAVFTFSCEDFVQLDTPKTDLIREDVFTDNQTATSAISAIYYQMINTSFANGNYKSITVLGGFLSDELTWFSQFITSQQFYENAIVPSNEYVSDIWGTNYNLIYQANSIIEGLNGISDLTLASRDQIIGEAKFIRAFCHFYLINLFGNVPYITTTDYRINGVVSRASKEQVYQEIIADLLEAQELLADDYSYSGGERIRLNKWAATAMLARVYLYNEEWAKAEVEATAVINNIAMYRLVALDSVFLKNNDEAIWQLMIVDDRNYTNEGQTFILQSAPSYLALSDEIVNAFEAGDLRRDIWVDSIITETGTYYYPYKYKDGAGAVSLSEYSMVMRLAEQYLIRAEARAQQSKLTGSNSAEADINIIRIRAGLDSTIATTQPELLLAIEQERRAELFAEWGHRWLDLKRTSRVDEVLDPIKPGWESTDALLPIPESELLINSRLQPQNPGYD